MRKRSPSMTMVVLRSALCVCAGAATLEPDTARPAGKSVIARAMLRQHVISRIGVLLHPIVHASHAGLLRAVRATIHLSGRFGTVADDRAAAMRAARRQL